MDYNVAKMNVADLPFSEQNVLEQIYGAQASGAQGYSPNHIVYVRELTPAEAGLFSQSSMMRPVGSMMQNLYKIRGRLLPPHFNRALHTMVRECDALRLNYCPVGERVLAVVLQERRNIAPVVYRNLEHVDPDDLDATLRRIMDADMRQGFDVRHGILLRFSVFHTKGDEYAVLVTGVQAMMTNFDVRQLFAKALGLKGPAKTVKEDSLGQLAALAAPVRDYWVKMLDKFPHDCRIPQYEKKSKVAAGQGAYLAHVPSPVLSELRERAKDNKRMLVSILQTAWGVLLQRENACRDVGFCLLVPRRQQENSSMGSAPSLVPVRVQVQDKLTVQELVNKVFQQFVISQPYAALGRGDIESIMGQQRGAFDHFLDFCDFFCEPQAFAEVPGSVEGQLVLQNFWDGRDSRLGIGFRQEENQLILSLQYDEGGFDQQSIEELVRNYLLVLQQMLTDWNLDYEAFMERLGTRLQGERAAVTTDKLGSRASLQNYLSRLTLLQEFDSGLIQLFMEYVQPRVVFEGDRIDETEMGGKLVFLVSGRVARSMEMGDGWYYTLDIQKENSWLNEMVMLPDSKTHLSLEVLTEQAVILTIPLIAVVKIMEKTPLLSKSIIQHVIRQMEIYQRLWIQS